MGIRVGIRFPKAPRLPPIRISVPTPEDIVKPIERTAEAVAGAVVDAVGAAAGAVGGVLQPVAETTLKLPTAIVRAKAELLENAVRELANGIEVVEKNLELSAGDVEDLGRSIGTFLEVQAQGLEGTLDATATRLREGKLVDAIWGSATGILESQEDSLFAAISESKLAAAIASAAATAALGPAGSAAFAAWFTYHATDGDLRAALKAGLVSYAVGELNGKVDRAVLAEKMSGIRALSARCAIAGAAAAAMGASDENVLSAMVDASRLELAKDVYRSVVDSLPEGVVPTEGNEVKLDDQNNYVAEQPKNISVRISQVGLAANTNKADFWGVSEASGAMQSVAKIPLMNDMARFHDQWCHVANMESAGLVAVTIIPALMVTYSASNGMATLDVVHAAIEGRADGEEGDAP